MSDERGLGIEELNRCELGVAAERLRACCGSSRWVEGMLWRRPFADLETLLTNADELWSALEPEDWQEAFAHHPRIGEPARDEVGRQAKAWSAAEQHGAAQADAATRQALAHANAEYERRFGRVYLVCASGRSAEDLLADCRRRLANDPDTELRVAAEEQRRITRRRLLRLVAGGD